ncbi:hypothetical protein PROFUN_16538 [Planoprotostelium fungivorum]|uniref:Uncharacterized protein n=1 Tax=Planoprotostelium fungivorum TaxID=1890364 RepID=A0A2P6MQJ9_9EUKA|nr:hypothetical protein PROFUN_16538 [Planoprotostelium fungivorum]
MTVIHQFCYLLIDSPVRSELKLHLYSQFSEGLGRFDSYGLCLRLGSTRRSLRALSVIAPVADLAQVRATCPENKPDDQGRENATLVLRLVLMRELKSRQHRDQSMASWDIVVQIQNDFTLADLSVTLKQWAITSRKWKVTVHQAQATVDDCVEWNLLVA